jgi:serine/threonine-protein kinase RsbT
MILTGARKAFSLELKSVRDVALARRRVGDFMQQRGSRDLMQTRFVTAVSEIARNTVTHGRGGSMDVFSFSDKRRIGVEFRDGGPGIPDIDAAMSDGFSTGGSLGRGLGGAKRLSSAFQIESTPGSGTIVRMTGLLQNTR